MPKSSVVYFFLNKFLFFRATEMFISKIFKGAQKNRFADRVRENYFITDLEKKIF